MTWEKKCPDCDGLLVDDGYDPQEQCDMYLCSNCGGYFRADGDFDEIPVEDSDDDDIPEGCKACGADYPNCKTSCNAFDD